MQENTKKLGEKLKSAGNSIGAFFGNAYNNHIIILYIVISLLINLIIEMMAKGSPIKGIYYLISSPYVFICNAFIIFMTLSISLLIRKRVFGAALISAVWIIFGVTNAVLLSNRVTPFTAPDLMLIGSAFAVMNKYFSIIQFVLAGLGIALVIFLLVVLFIKAPKIKKKVKYIRTIITIVVIWILGFGAIELGLVSGLIPHQFGNLRDAYSEYGFVYCFTNSVVNTGVSRPSDYSSEKMQDLVEEEDSKKVKETPNIIFLQLESFFDLNNMTNIELSDNPVPYFEELMSEYPSGYLNVPVVGAGTVNTEFEIMTGMNLDDFGPGEYPFKTVLKKKSCESICYNLKAYDYSCHAIHNNTATFYSRNIVFSNLGYDTFTSIENMYVDEFTPEGWAKDYFLTGDIIDTLKSTKGQDYIYTISVQGHGSYPSDGDYDYPFTVTGLDDEGLTNQYQYYAWQTNEMDQFLRELTSALEDFGEDTILIMYGDHLPSLGITAENLINGDVYQTQYVIWSNVDYGYTGGDTEAYQMQAKILEKLNMSEGEINSYNQNHIGDYSDEYLDGLRTLEYDQLYGDNLATNGENPYIPTDMHFGLYDVKVNSISPLYDADGTTYVYGKNFTRYSKVYINGDKQQTVYMDPNTLMIMYPDLEEGDEISVYQQNSDRHVLSQTEPYKYTAEETGNKNKKIKSKGSKKKKNKKNKAKKNKGN